MSIDMTFDKALSISEKISASKLNNFKDDLFETAVRYARIRTDWYFIDEDEKRINDELRTRTHNSLVDACNILSREMIILNEDAGWRIELGNDRKEIGDFACYVHCLFGLTSR